MGDINYFEDDQDLEYEVDYILEGYKALKKKCLEKIKQNKKDMCDLINREGCIIMDSERYELMEGLEMLDFKLHNQLEVFNDLILARPPIEQIH